MYSIFCDGKCIHDDLIADKNCKVIDPVLKLADNSAGSLEMTIPPDNPGYDILKRMLSTITVYMEATSYIGKRTEIWEGRVIHEETDFWNQRKVTCEGELTYLNDVLQPHVLYENETVIQFITDILAVHNANVAENRRFELGEVTIGGTDVFTFETNYETTLSCLIDILVTQFNGHVRVRKGTDGKRYLDYIKDYPNMNTQTITFGKNLIDFTRNWDMSDLATVIIPRGEQLKNPTEEKVENRDNATKIEDYVTVAEANGGSKYVTIEEAIKTYGWVECTVDFEGITDPAELLKKAQEYITDTQFDKMHLQVNAVDMHYMSTNTEPIKLLDQIRCISPPHGLDKVFPVTELEIPLTNPENTNYTLGTDVKTSFTASNNEKNKEFQDKIDSIPEESEILDQAKENAKQIMEQHTRGYVTILQDRQFSDGKQTEAIVISNMPIVDPTQLSSHIEGLSYWIWNMDGLAFYTTDHHNLLSSTNNPGWDVDEHPELLVEEEQGDKTVDRDIRIAITMDGSICANYITAGTMSANRIRTGRIEAVNGNSYFDLDDGSLVMKSGEINLNNGTFSVSREGFVKASSGNIGGFTITSGDIHNDMVTLDSNGISFYVNSVNQYIANIGWTKWIGASPNRYGVSFNLDDEGTYMAWSKKKYTFVKADKEDEKVDYNSDIVYYSTATQKFYSEPSCKDEYLMPNDKVWNDETSTWDELEYSPKNQNSAVVYQIKESGKYYYYKHWYTTEHLEDGSEKKTEHEEYYEIKSSYYYETEMVYTSEGLPGMDGKNGPIGDSINFFCNTTFWNDIEIRGDIYVKDGHRVHDMLFDPYSCGVSQGPGSWTSFADYGITG